jgi:DNA polymerase I
MNGEKPEVANLEKKFVIIDGNSIANRAFYALPPMNNANGQHTNAAYGFTTMLLKVLDEQKPTHLLVAFDAGKIVFRHQNYAEYKGGRQKTPSELSEQFPYIKEILHSFDIATYELEGYEADDIIGTLTKQAEEQTIPTVIVTGDKDMLQLVSANTHVALTRKGISEVEWYTPDAIQERYGLQPSQIIDLKGLMGDASDNIPGVPGVGEKTALKLLHEYETVENVLNHAELISGKKLKEKIIEHQADAIQSKELATILRDAPVTINIDAVQYLSYQSEKTLSVLRKFEFKSLYERFGTVKVETPKQSLSFTIVQDENKSAYEAFLGDNCAFHLEIDQNNYHRASILGFGVESNGECFYIPFEVGKNWTKFKEWLAEENNKSVYDGKQAIVALSWQGLTLKGIAFDILIASYLLNPSESDTSLSEAAMRAAGHKLPSDTQVYGKGAKWTVPEPEVIAEHVVRKAVAVREAQSPLEEGLNQREMAELFYSLELPLSFVLAEMEISGIRVDEEKLYNMGVELEHQLEELTTAIYSLAGVEFNINSPKQLGEILFDKLGLPVMKKTKTGYSTSADILEKLQEYHEIIPKILHYRQLGKLHSTYIEGLKKEIRGETGKIHTSFNQATTATGRLSSTEPNLQNIPIRMEEGRKIREAFVPSHDGSIIFSADYSQIELRVLAHIANDEKLKEAFLSNADIHTRTAANVFGVTEEEVTSMMRRNAKAVNFGIVYGISDYGLSQNLNISRKEAAQFIESYFAIFKGVKQYMADIVKQAKLDGYVTTLLNRRRYLPDINSSNFNVRSFAERTAMNTPIQGTAADIIKLAMVKMQQILKERNLKSKMLIQVHDELVFEVPEDELEEMKRLVPEVMEGAMELNVPLKVDVNYGKTWYDAK